ncbi:hypothetical protein MKX03_001363 [Papaver bracteatum]|nr:hypothetical protein MKX03_001363 [Papaver bracteatum]
MSGSSSVIVRNNSYLFIIDLSGYKPNACKEIKVVVCGRSLTITCPDVSPVWNPAKFTLAPDANTDHDISAVCHDGLLTVSVKKLDMKYTKTVNVKTYS